MPLPHCNTKRGSLRVVCSLLSGRAIRIDDIRPFPTRTDYQEEVQVCYTAYSERFDCIYHVQQQWYALLRPGIRCLGQGARRLRRSVL